MVNTRVADADARCRRMPEINERMDRSHGLPQFEVPCSQETMTDRGSSRAALSIAVCWRLKRYLRRYTGTCRCTRGRATPRDLTVMRGFD